MSRMTTWRRMKKLCIKSDTVDMWAFERSFDPIKAYSCLCKYRELRDLMIKHCIKSVTELSVLLEESKNG